MEPKSNTVESGDLKSTQDSAPKAQKWVGWLVPVAVIGLVGGVPFLIWSLFRRKSGKTILWIVLFLLACVGVLIWHRLKKKRSQEADAAPKEAKADEGQKAAKSHACSTASKKYGRFSVEEKPGIFIVTDTLQSYDPYNFKADTNTWERVLKLLKNHATGTDQICKTDRVWTGAFQERNKTAARFCREQVFMQPRWDVSRRRYLNKQYEGRWRLWMNDEITMPEQERIRRFKEAHPHGYGK